MGSLITLALVYLTVFSRKINAQEATIDVDEPDGTRSLDPGPAGSSPRSLRSSPPAKTSAYATAVSHAQDGGLLTGIMAQLWSHMNLAIAKSVKETVEPMFKVMLPGPLSSLHFTKLDLGTVPIRMDNVSILITCHDHTLSLYSFLFILHISQTDCCPRGKGRCVAV